jgi:hypothetical protein
MGHYNIMEISVLVFGCYITTRLVIYVGNLFLVQGWNKDSGRDV